MSPLATQRARWLAVLGALLALPAAGQGTEPGRRTILYEDAATELGPGLPGTQDFWVTTAELTRAPRELDARKKQL